MVLEGFEPVRAALASGTPVLLVAAHQCNWEWMLLALSLELGYPLEAAYKPLVDGWAQREMLKARSRFGARLVPAQELLAHILRGGRTPRAIAMVADQEPRTSERRHWTRFMNRDTAFFMGAEEITRVTKFPAFFVGLRRTGRGHYAVSVTPLAQPGEKLPTGALTERYAGWWRRRSRHRPPTGPGRTSAGSSRSPCTPGSRRQRCQAPRLGIYFRFGWPVQHWGELVSSTRGSASLASPRFSPRRPGRLPTFPSGSGAQPRVVHREQIESPAPTIPDQRRIGLPKAKLAQHDERSASPARPSSPPAAMRIRWRPALYSQRVIDGFSGNAPPWTCRACRRRRTHRADLTFVQLQLCQSAPNCDTAATGGAPAAAGSGQRHRLDLCIDARGSGQRNAAVAGGTARGWPARRASSFTGTDLVSHLTAAAAGKAWI